MLTVRWDHDVDPWEIFNIISALWNEWDEIEVYFIYINTMLIIVREKRENDITIN